MSGVIALVIIVYLGGVVFRDSIIGMLMIAGVVGLGILGLFLVRPQYGAFAFILTTYTNVSTLFVEQGLPSINKPLAALFFMLVILIYLINNELPELLPKGIEWYLIGYVFAQAITLILRNEMSEAPGIIIDTIKDMVIIFIITRLIREPISFKRAIWIIVITVSILAILGNFQSITGNYSQTFFGLASTNEKGVVEGVVENRAAGPIGRTNFWGLILSATVPLALYLAILEKRPIVKIILLLAAFQIVFAVFNTFSRGAFLATVAALILIGIEQKVRFDRVLFVGVAAIIFLQILSPIQIQRILSIGDLASEGGTQESSSYRGRSSEMLAGLYMFADHPLTGVGVGHYEANYLDYAKIIGLETRNEQRQAHSLYIELLAETGLLGTSIFLALFAILNWQLFRLGRRLRSLQLFELYILSTAIQYAIITYLLGSVFLHGEFIRFLWVLVALGITAITLYSREISAAEQASDEQVAPSGA